ncbi:hypothetical protein Goarm_016506 [Gossypium armourianum]|uniref:Uncharacterized protein n=1 Tax=Gossypium armourianum TaxID=34283 RepID=A0A7J9JCF4_9ROSI|nr:hypothetical protein [Gossypium armourianum]
MLQFIGFDTRIIMRPLVTLNASFDHQMNYLQRKRVCRRMEMIHPSYEPTNESDSHGSKLKERKKKGFIPAWHIT